jgi:opacity protein-like surface antigen
MRLAAFLLFSSVCAFSQPFGAGLKVGVPFTDFVDKATSGSLGDLSHPKRVIFGVSGELRLPFHLAIEVDALYRRMSYDAVVTTGGNTILLTSTANTWEFPILAKYRFGGEAVRPFVGAGVAFNSLRGLTQSVRSAVTGATLTPITSNPTETTTKGFVTGFGVDLKALFLHVQPEIRFTRWGAKRFFDPSGILSSNQNQVEFLVGLSF